jgi:hypothetical protein
MTDCVARSDPLTKRQFSTDSQRYEPTHGRTRSQSPRLLRTLWGIITFQFQSNQNQQKKSNREGLSPEASSNSTRLKAKPCSITNRISCNPDATHNSRNASSAGEVGTESQEYPRYCPVLEPGLLFLQSSAVSVVPTMEDGYLLWRTGWDYYS